MVKKLFLGMVLPLCLMSQVMADVSYEGDSVTGRDAQSSGDGASVSATVEFVFKIGRKLGLAIHDGNGFTSNALFAPVIFDNSSKFAEPSVLSFVFDGSRGDPDLNDQNYSRQGFKINGAIFTSIDNATLSFAGSSNDFVHENDSSSVITLNSGVGSRGYLLTDSGEVSNLNGRVINASDLLNSDGIARFSMHRYIDMSTFDSTDRAGRYNGTTVITVTTP